MLDERGLRASGLCKHLGITTNMTTNWKQRGTDPPAKYVIPICEYLDCSLEPAPGISENGREMLALYERLPERQQILLIGRLQEMVEPLASPNEKDIAIASDGEAI